MRSIRPPPTPSLRRPSPTGPWKGLGVPQNAKKYSQKIELAFSLPSRSRKRISSRARASNMVEFEVNFSRGVKNRGCLFPKMVLFEGPRPSKSLSKTLKSVSPTLEITQIRSFSGLQTLLRETNPRGWDGQSIPEITFFPIKCQNRLRMSGKKWRLPILFLQPEPSISSILSITGYRCCADFVFHHGFCLLRNRNSSSAVISSPTGLGCQLGSRFGMHRQGILLVRH